MSECYRDSKPSTGAYAPSLRFADKVRGEAALDLVSGELWVCSRHPDGQFVTERKATALDLQAVADLLTQARARIQTLEGALRHYGQHDPGCVDRSELLAERDAAGTDCTCGLREMRGE